MNIGFRVDASTRIGSGHWSRCIFIAERIKKNNKIFFISRELPGNKLYQIRNRFSLIKLQRVKKYKFNKNSHDSSNNLGVLEKKDYFETLHYLQKYKIEVLIIDHYSINETYKKLIKENLKLLIVIDDFVNKKHFADIYINNNFLNKKEISKIKSLNPKCKLALGSDFLLINEKFYNLKQKVVLRKKIKKILVFFGTIDPNGVTIKVLKALKKIPNIKVAAITSKLNPKFKKLKEVINKEKNFKIYTDINNYQFGQIILSSDIAIGACGVNALERLYLGLPSIIISTAKNQIVSSLNLERKNLIKYLGRQENVKTSDIYRNVVSFLKNPNSFERFSKRCYNSIQSKKIYNLRSFINTNLKYGKK